MAVFFGMSTTKQRARPVAEYARDPDFLALCAALLASHGNRAAAAQAIGVSRQHLAGALLPRYPAAADIFPCTMGRPRRSLAAEPDSDETYASAAAKRARDAGLSARFVKQLAPPASPRRRRAAA